MRERSDTSIEEIEQAIRKARFDESETEKFVRDRAHVRGRNLARKQYRTEKMQNAFIAGYREGYDQSHKRLVYVLAVAIAVIGTIWVVQTLF